MISFEKMENVRDTFTETLLRACVFEKIDLEAVWSYGEDIHYKNNKNDKECIKIKSVCFDLYA